MRVFSIVVVAKRQFVFLFLTFLVTVSLSAQGIRERIRVDTGGTKVSATQAADLTLTLGTAAKRSIQQVVRTGGTIDKSHKVITATITTADGRLCAGRPAGPQLSAGIESFDVSGTCDAGRFARWQDCRRSNTVRRRYEGRVNYVVEIIVERGVFLCIPSEAIIEEGDHRSFTCLRKTEPMRHVRLRPGFRENFIHRFSADSKTEIRL